MHDSKQTHRLLVSAYLMRDDQFLLLHRKTPPLVWAPPGGHLDPDEDPVQGLLREIREETQIEAEVLAPANTWFGDLGRGPVVSIDFLAQYRSGEVRLSTEHDEYRWASLEQLRHRDPDLGQSPHSFKLDHFERAYRLYRFMMESR